MTTEQQNLSDSLTAIFEAQNTANENLTGQLAAANADIATLQQTNSELNSQLIATQQQLASHADDSTTISNLNAQIVSLQQQLAGQ